MDGKTTKERGAELVTGRVLCCGSGSNGGHMAEKISSRTGVSPEVPTNFVFIFNINYSDERQSSAPRTKHINEIEIQFGSFLTLTLN